MSMVPKLDSEHSSPLNHRFTGMPVYYFLFV